MTDARLPGRWLHDPAMESLTDRLWRVHTGALMWSNDHGTDGLIPRRTLRLLHPDGATPLDGQGLVSAGLWASEGDGFRVLGWALTQSLAADVEHQRERNRLKNQTLRERERQKRTAAPERSPGMPAAPGHVTGHVVGQDRTGQDRQGQDRHLRRR